MGADAITTAGMKALLESGVLAVIVSIQLGFILHLLRKVLSQQEQVDATVAQNTAAFKAFSKALEARKCLVNDRVFDKDS